MQKPTHFEIVSGLAAYFVSAEEPELKLFGYRKLPAPDSKLF